MTAWAVNGKEPSGVWCPSRDDSGNGTTTLYDLVGSNNGTLTNFALTGSTSNWVSDTGAGGIRALDQDGTNDYVSVPNWIGKPTTFSVSMWIKLAANQTTRTIFSNYDGVGFGWVVGISDSATNKIKFFLGSATNLFSSFALTNGVWYHVLAAYSSASPVLYINGTLDASSSASVTYSGTATGNNNLGNLAPNIAQFFNGRYDDIRVWNGTKLDATDAAYLYASGSGRGIQTGAKSRRRRSQRGAMAL